MIKTLLVPVEKEKHHQREHSFLGQVHHCTHRRRCAHRRHLRHGKATSLCVLLLSCFSVVHGFIAPSHIHAVWQQRFTPAVNTCASTPMKRLRCSPMPQPLLRFTSPTRLRLVRHDGGGAEEHHRSKKIRLEVFKTLNLPAVEVFLVLAVLLSSLLVALDTLQNLPDTVYLAIGNAILTLNLIFAFDFFIRWYAAGQFKAIYLTKPLVVLDILVVILPLILGSTVVPLLQSFGVTGESVSYLDGLQNSAGLENLLLLRILRLRRVLTDTQTFGNFSIALGVKPKDIRPYQLQLARVSLSIFTLLSVASGLIYTAEHEVNPDIPDYFSALYFGITTLTTVGFGDVGPTLLSCDVNEQVTPVTAQGRLIVAGSILAGVAIIPTQAAKLVDIFIESQKDLEQKKLFKRRQRRASSFISISGKQPTSVQSATDGKGPSGVSIEIPPREERDESALPNVGQDVIGRTCNQCTASPHRADAAYCWSCGAKL